MSFPAYPGTEGEEKRCIAAARTFLYNYGQGVYTPMDVYFDCCHLVDCKPMLCALPDFKLLPAFSFFSKKHLRFAGAQFCLFDRDDEVTHFFSLGMAAKINWLHNFCTMQILLFNFSPESLERIETILTSWQRPAYDYSFIPFTRADGTDLCNTRPIAGIADILRNP